MTVLGFLLLVLLPILAALPISPLERDAFEILLRSFRLHDVAEFAQALDDCPIKNSNVQCKRPSEVVQSSKLLTAFLKPTLRSMPAGAQRLSLC